MDYYALMVSLTRSRWNQPIPCTGEWGSCPCAGCDAEREYHWTELALEDARMGDGR